MNDRDGAVGLSTLRGACVALLAWAVLAWPGAAAAQDAAEGAVAEPGVEVLLLERALVGLEGVEPESVVGPIWTLQAQPGRRLVALPVRLEVRGELGSAVELSEPEVGVAGGRFLTWVVPSVADAAELMSGVAEAGEEATEEADEEALFAAMALGADGTRLDPEMAVPRLSRRVQVLPDGRIGWRMERAIQGGSVVDGEEPYALRLRSDRLRALEPPPAQRVTRNAGEDSAAFRFRQIEAQQEQRDAQMQFRRLRNLVNALPSAFVQEMPEMVWAVYDAPRFSSALELEGPAPLPMTLSEQEWLAVRALATGDHDAEEMTIETGQLLFDAQGIVAKGSPMGARLVAEALSLAGVVGALQVDGPGYELMSALLGGPDEAAAGRVVMDLAGVVPPTRATAALLREASTRLTPEQRLAALVAQIAGAAEDPLLVPDAMKTASGLLLEEGGAEASRVLSVVAESVEGTSVAEDAGRLPVSALLGDRWRDAVGYLASAAEDSEMASTLLREQVLTVRDAARLTAALEEIAALPDAVDSADGVLIPIDTRAHPILELLGSSDGRVRGLAWRALPRFVAGPNDVEGVLEAAADRAVGTTEARLALAFLVHQPGAPVEGLSAAMTVADQVGDASAVAGPLVGSGAPLADAMSDSEPVDRVALVRAVLTATGNSFWKIEQVFLSDYRDVEAAAAWFGQRTADGNVPTAVELANEIGEVDLVGLLASGDKDLRDGAATALTALAGGDATDAPQVAAKLEREPDRTDAALFGAWTPAKQELVSRRLMSAAGDYVVSLRLPGAVEPEDVGLVQLLVDGRLLAFAGNPMELEVPDDRLAIRLGTVEQLKSLGVRDLNELPLERVRVPLDLLATATGGWSGAVMVPGAGELGVALRPMAE
ncbi:MAG: hypothetical protein AAF823_13815 [Planctomycetota bacterium]